MSRIQFHAPASMLEESARNATTRLWDNDRRANPG
jgi:hypothetical protein